MKRVYFLTYYFPPVGGVGAIRAAKFAKYLPEFGWEPVVFHAGRGHRYIEDPSLLNELRSSLHRIPVRTYEGASVLNRLDSLGLRFATSRLLRLAPIDAQIGWVWPAIRAAREEAARSGRPAALFTSSAPYSSVLAGLWLRRTWKLPWVADFRDEWTQNPALRFSTPLHRTLAAHIERKAMAEADAVVTVTPALREQFNALRTRGQREVEVIRNGFDEDDFQDPAPQRDSDRWTIGFIGTAYAATDPSPVIQALQMAALQGEVDGARVHFVHAGNGQIAWPTVPVFAVTTLGYVTHAEAVAWMRRVHLLVLVIHRAEAASSRVYEHLRAGTPTLCVAPPDGEAAALVCQMRAGVVVAPQDVEGIAKALCEYYQTWREGRFRPLVPSAELAVYSRREAARHLASVLDAVASTHQS